jgi:hypothetical protein
MGFLLVEDCERIARREGARITQRRRGHGDSQRKGKIYHPSLQSLRASRENRGGRREPRKSGWHEDQRYMDEGREGRKEGSLQKADPTREEGA